MQRSSGRSYLTRMGFRNIRANRTMSVASVLVLVSCLMLIGLVFLAAINLNVMMNQFYARNVIMVYLRDDAQEAELTRLQYQIEALDTVKEVRFISSQEALERTLSSNQDTYALLEGLDMQFMPQGFEVQPRSMEQYTELIEQLRLIDPSVESVRHFQGIAAQLSALQKALSIAGVAMISILLVVSVFIISSTVQATMYSRQQEIKVMKSVGAAPSFIRWPFLVEGISLGVLGSLVSMAFVFVVYLALGKALEPLLGKLMSGAFALVPFLDHLPLLLLSFICVGLITGVGGSTLSISRYLKEKVYEKSELES
ncbi:MAG: ABC transporter permease [Oscillospiraceae bacterium]|nr:ABC transporter permease [Oscillospiraceae bacterium]